MLWWSDEAAPRKYMDTYLDIHSGDTKLDDDPDVTAIKSRDMHTMMRQERKCKSSSTLGVIIIVPVI